MKGMAFRKYNRAIDSLESVLIVPIKYTDLLQRDDIKHSYILMIPSLLQQVLMHHPAAFLQQLLFFPLCI